MSVKSLRELNPTARSNMERAKTADVRAIRALVDANASSGRLLDKATVALFEDVQEFWVASSAEGEILGCGALHVMWEDLAEIRTVAVHPSCQGHGVGRSVGLAQGRWSGGGQVGGLLGRRHGACVAEFRHLEG